MNVQATISFIVPCLNEELNVEATVNEIRAATNREVSYEILLVDDSSTDRTMDRMRELAAGDDRVRVLHNAINLGLGGSYKRGIAAAKMLYTMLIPGDNGFPADSIRTVLNYTGKADIVIPYVENIAARSPLRVLISQLFTRALNILFWLDVRYYNGTVLYKTSLLRTIEITTNGFAYQAEALIKLICRGATYVHCPVHIRDRVAGSSSALTIKNLVAVLKTILHLLAHVGAFRGLRLSANHRKK